MNLRSSSFNLLGKHNLCWLFLISLLMLGCASQEEIARKRVENTPAYRPVNVYAVPDLPVDIRRVAILPVNALTRSEETCTMLQSQAATALAKTNRLEAITLTNRDLLNLYGMENLSATQVLPHDFFNQLRQTYAADAVLFTELTLYDPYQPMQLGLRMNLVDVENGDSLWAFDDIFDAGDARVASGAVQHQEMNNRIGYPLNDAYRVLQSPSQFAQYAFATAFATLPNRATTLETLTVTDHNAQSPSDPSPYPKDQPTSRHPEIPKLY